MLLLFDLMPETEVQTMIIATGRQFCLSCALPLLFFHKNVMMIAKKNTSNNDAATAVNCFSGWFCLGFVLLLVFCCIWCVRVCVLLNPTIIEIFFTRYLSRSSSLLSLSIFSPLVFFPPLSSPLSPLPLPLRSIKFYSCQPKRCCLEF